MAIEFRANSDFGQTGQYIARITGRAKNVTFAREFVGRKSGKRNDVTTALVDEPGLYEVVNCTRKGKDRDYWIVLEHEGELKRIRSDEEDFLAIAKRLDGSETLEQIVVFESVAREPEVLAAHPEWSATRLVYTIRNKLEVNRAIVATTIDAVVLAIVNAVGGLPKEHQKKALAEAKNRLFPKAERPKPAKMTKADAITFVKSCGENDGPETYAEAAEIFEALYGRAPDTTDGDQGQIWSLCCAAT